MRIKLRKPDTLFSKYLREKRKRCEKCGNINSLQVSHFWGRRNENTRYCEINCDVLCFSCHQYFEENPEDYREWKLEKLGKETFDKLKLSAHLYCKRDDKLREMEIKERIKLSTSKID